MTFGSLLRPYRWRIIILVLCLFAINGLALALPWGIKLLIDDVLIRRDIPGLHRLSIYLIVILLVRAGLNFFRYRQSALMGERIICRVRERLYEKALRLAVPSFRAQGAGSLLTRMTGDLDSLRRFLFGEAVEFVYSILGVAMLLAVLVVLNVKLAAVALLGVPVFLRIYFRLFPQLRSNYRAVRESWGALIARAGEVLNAVMTVRTLNGQDRERAYLRTGQEGLLHTAASVHHLNAGLWMAVDLFSSLCTVAALWLGGLEVIRDRMTQGELVAFYTYLGMLLAPLARLTLIQGTQQEAAAALERINEIMDIPHVEPPDRPGAAAEDIAGQLSFMGVSFGYAEGGPVLRGVNFQVRQGETVGIVGASGTGKTTLVNLLLRFYRPDAGRILLDGRPLDDFDLHGFRRQVAVVLQDDVLLSGTIRENIAYGHAAGPGAVEEAARLACAHDFIMALPKGYETAVGEKGDGLSTGQRQRIAIARALLRRPAVLILDEATSAVDAMTENRIQDAVRRVMAGKTTLIIAHRFSTLADADRIIVLDGGRVVDEHLPRRNNRGIKSNDVFRVFHVGASSGL